MKTLLTLTAALFWQMASLSAGPAAVPQHLRYERAIALPAGASGQACAVLDASVFAHAAAETLNDVRLFAKNSTVEVPFTLTESATQHPEDESAQVRNVAGHNGEVSFDLAMPSRPYTTVVLDLAAKDFLATAHIFGVRGVDKRTDLGSFALFDLNAQQLSRSTALPLQESTFPKLHVELHLKPAPGSQSHDLGPAVVKGASVPPSREDQTLYTTVTETTEIAQQDHESIATIRISAHVPVERVSLALDPSFDKNFARTIHITATPDAARGSEDVETIQGDVSRVKLAADSNSGVPIDSRKMSVDAVLGANLGKNATVELAIENGDQGRLPLRSVRLEMRQRRICFDAVTDGAPYILMYGDGLLRVPFYGYAREFAAAAQPIAATLGGERVNPAFIMRVDRRSYSERHPELVWVMMLAIVAVLGSVALRNMRRHRQRR